jgi:ribosomal protein S18 acetylase RimI-like enzyme
VRLAALREAPYAFASTYEREVKATEATWRTGLLSRTRFVAEVDGEVVGTVSGGPGKARDASAVTAMWVDPSFRRRGIGDLLLTTVLDWIRSQPYREVFLWVTEGNENAERLYVRHGFVRTGVSEEVRPGQLEFELTRKL